MCRLRSLFVAEGARFTGYDEHGLVEVGEKISIGRGAKTCAIATAAMIGGRQTFVVFRRGTAWVFKVNNEHAKAIVDGERLAEFGAFESRPIHDGSVIELLHAHTDEVLHRFRVELDDD